jgi:hypothetical protein
MISIMSEFRMGGPGLMDDRLAFQGETGVSLKTEKPRRFPLKLSGIVLEILRIIAVAQERVHSSAPVSQPSCNLD